MSDVHLVRMTVNGTVHEVAVEPRRTLADVLRHDLGYTGTHLGCEHGICGACTVLVDGDPTRACLVFGVQADDCEIETVEGLAAGDALSPLQEAFADHHAVQCGFCTPGFLMLATALLRSNPHPSDAEIRDAIAANICRCTGYAPILAAVRAVSRAGADDAPATAPAPAAAGTDDAPDSAPAPADA